MNLDEFYIDTNKTTEETTIELARVEEGQLIIAEKMRNKLIEFETKRKEIEEKEKEMKQKLEEIMRANGISGYESNDKRIKITLGDDNITDTIDKEKLWLEYPEVYKQVRKESFRKGSLRITIREDK